jgi:hypothetical protein
MAAGAAVVVRLGRRHETAEGVGHAESKKDRHEQCEPRGRAHA